MYSPRLSQVYDRGLVFIPSRQQSRSKASWYLPAGGTAGENLKRKRQNFKPVRAKELPSRAWLTMDSRKCFIFLHNVLMTSVIVLARFFLEGTLHFSSGKSAQLVSIYKGTVHQTIRLMGGGRGGRWFTLSVGSARSCVGLKQQTSITKHSQTVLPPTWCAACVVFLHNVPDLERWKIICKGWTN